MQEKYVGDIGDYAKYSLLRALSYDRTLGVSWYLFSEEEGTNDGKHIKYLCDSDKWQRFDERTFEILKQVVKAGKRRISEIEKSDLFPQSTVFWNTRLDFQGCAPSEQAAWRTDWFKRSRECLIDRYLVFVDPDNGLMESDKFRPGQRKHAKSIPECEVHALADGDRPVVIYHHNTRRPGGHDAEVRYWQKRLGGNTCAVRWCCISPRTFFILNCTKELAKRASEWCKAWESPEKVFFKKTP